MSESPATQPIRDRERGAVLATVAIWLPALVLFVIFVVDMGNWFEHKRHLQLQADAGALAAGASFTLPCNDAAIEAKARKYGGDPGVADPFNVQVAPTAPENVHVLINSTDFWNHGGTNYSDGGQPCTTKFVDVKITEADLPWFFGVDVVPAINARARVTVEALTMLGGALPVGVPEVKPKSGKAIFINEDTGAELASLPLAFSGEEGDLAIWQTSGGVAVPIVDRVGVRIALSGSSSTTCGERLVVCYDFESDDGILFIRGWPTGGSGAQPNAPIARDVQLQAASCTDPYFVSASSPCTVGIRAQVDFGGDPASVGASLTAVVDGVETGLGYDAASGYWTGSASIPTLAGPVGVELKWAETIGTVGGNTCTTTGGNKCKGTFGTVHRVFSASDPRSGPIAVAQVWNYDDPGSPTFLTNSFPGGSTHTLGVKIGIAGALENATSVDSPLVLLRLSGSQNQSVDCDPDLPNLRDEIANGCEPDYVINPDDTCPATASSLWGQPQPWNCVAVQTGGAVGQVEHGMADRILGGANTCTSPSNWSSIPNLPPSDPRIVPVFLTPFGSFAGSGNDVFPVRNFGAFYVTGWWSSPCSGDDPVPARGYVIGRFIKHIFTLNEGGGGGTLCDFTAFGSCIAVLTD